MNLEILKRIISNMEPPEVFSLIEFSHSRHMWTYLNLLKIEVIGGQESCLFSLYYARDTGFEWDFIYYQFFKGFYERYKDELEYETTN